MDPREEYKSVVEPMKTKEEAAAYVANTIDQGFAAVCLGLGVQVGLFDVLAGMDGPATVEEIATAGDFKEKYVKELLAVTVYHKLLCYDEGREKFWLPETHRDCLTGVRSSMLALVPILTLPFHELVACFKKNGPNGFVNDDFTIYEHNERLNKSVCTLDFIENSVLSREPNLVQKLDRGIRVLDAGCALGHMVTVLAKRFPSSEFVGIDLSENKIQIARKTAEAEVLSQVDFVTMDIYKMPTDWTESFDLVISRNTIHMLPYVVKGLQEVRRVLTPGGRFLMLEHTGHSNIAGNVNDPAALFRQACSLLYCVPSALSFNNGGWSRNNLGTGADKIRFGRRRF